MKINMKTTLALLVIVGMGQASNLHGKTDENVSFKCAMTERFKIQNFWRVFNQFLVAGDKNSVDGIFYIMLRTRSKLLKKRLTLKNVNLTYDDVRSAYDEVMDKDEEYLILSDPACRFLRNEQNRDNAIVTLMSYHQNEIQLPEWNDDIIPNLQKMQKAFFKSRRDWESEK